MFLKKIQLQKRNQKIVALLGGDISVHVWRDADGHLMLGIDAPKSVPIVVEDNLRPIPVAKPR